MKKLRGFIPTMTMVAVMLFGATFANASIFKSEPRTPDTCTETTRRGPDWGIIIGGNLTGIIIGGNLIGIIIGGNLTSGKTQVNCGIIIGGNKDGGE